jgi:glutamate-1-semialdehyde aminotransferase
MPKSISLDPSFPCIDASNALYERARPLIPAGTQTLAKGVGQFVNGVAPKYLARGRGSHVWDVDGNEYIDFSMGVGPLSLGYAFPEVDAAIRAQLESGITFSLPHPLEVEVAESIASVVPGAEMVRFSKTGCDVTSAAVRLARASTGRDKVICCGYHGWHDWYVSVTDRSRGIPEDVAKLSYTFAYNDISSLRAALANDVACVILEPMVFEWPKDGFLAEVVRACRANGSLVVFDEMWTGFRAALGGAQQRFGVTADLACFSKAVANGMPLSVLTGRAEIMRLCEKDIFFFTTFGGEALRLRERYEGLCADLDLDCTHCVGMACRTLVTFAASGRAAGADPLIMKSIVQQELLRRGVLWQGVHNLCYSHSEADIDHLMAAYREALTVLKQALASGAPANYLRGAPMEPVFRKVAGFNTRPRIGAQITGEVARGRG